MEKVPTLEKDKFMVFFDLKNAYNHILIHPNLQPILGFCWKGNYCFIGMPFGLSDTPRIFTIIMKKVVKRIRELWNIKAKL
jgi:hypothetical protein